MTRSAPSGPPIETDAVIVGAGPAGLFQVFQLGLVGLKAHVVDSLDHPGGQCVELYADKPIYDIPAVPVCTGRELTDLLLRQIQPFGASLHLGQEVQALARRADGRFDLHTSAGLHFVTHAVVVAGGVGAFQPKPLRVPGIEAHLGTQLFYRVADASQFSGKRLLIVGGGDSALDWAAHFAQPGIHAAAGVTLLHRRDVFQAATATVTRVMALRDAGQLKIRVGQITSHSEHDGRLSRVQFTSPEGLLQEMEADAVLVFFGLSPKLGPMAHWGLAMDRKQLVVNTATFETSEPGIFAIGDIVTYPGKKKLIVSGFHEATLAAYAVARYIHPDQPQHLQYTTTSPKLHRALGVAPLNGIGTGPAS